MLVRGRILSQTTDGDIELGPGSADLGFCLGRRVVDSGALELGQPVQGKPVVLCAVAMMTDLAWMASPSSKVTRRTQAWSDSEAAFAASLIQTPNFCACSVPRAASSSPDKPAGKPR
jgi:hypothetical protein